MKAIYTCGGCNHTGGLENFEVCLLSMLFRAKHESIQAFRKVKCPKCMQLVTILMDSLDASKERKSGP